VMKRCTSTSGDCMVMSGWQNINFYDRIQRSILNK
jgi:hypothetical protein